MKDIRLAIGFIDHPKTIRLERLLGFEGVKSLLRLWAYAALNRPEGYLTSMDEDDIEIAAKWAGEPGAFFRTITSDKCRWIDIVEGGAFYLHDWEDNQGFVVHSKSRSEKGKRQNAARWHQNNQEALATENTTRWDRLVAARQKGTHTEEEWKKMVAFFDHRCVKCGTPSSTLQKGHVVSIYQEGSDAIENLQPLCKSCSCTKTIENIDYRLIHDPELRCLTSKTDTNFVSNHTNTDTNSDTNFVSNHTNTDTNFVSDDTNTNTNNYTNFVSVTQISSNTSYPPLPLPSPLPSPSPLPEDQTSLLGANESNGAPLAGPDQPAAAPDKKKKKKEKIPKPEMPKIGFDYTTGKFTNLRDSLYIQRWGKTFPGLDLIFEIRKAANWLLTHPDEDRTNLPNFLNNWLQKANKAIVAAPLSSTGSTIAPRMVSPTGEAAAGVRQSNIDVIRQVCERAGVTPDIHTTTDTKQLTMDKGGAFL